VATTHRVRLINGPCGGQVKTITQAEWDNGETTCKGAVYVYDGVIRPAPQLPHFTYRPGAPPPVTDANTQALKGWRDLRRSFNKHMPRALNESERLRHSALRALQRGRKV
jgi:hypothetical protein